MELTLVLSGGGVVESALVTRWARPPVAGLLGWDGAFFRQVALNLNGDNQGHHCPQWWCAFVMTLDSSLLK
jgi:hypothetical protein